jgi:hypothetical protein
VIRKPRPELAIGAAPSMSTPRASVCVITEQLKLHHGQNRPCNAVWRRGRCSPVEWSLYGSPWLQRVAINGKSDGRGSAENKPKPLPSVATGCREKYMVRRGCLIEPGSASPPRRLLTIEVGADYVSALASQGDEKFLRRQGFLKGRGVRHGPQLRGARVAQMLPDAGTRHDLDFWS